MLISPSIHEFILEVFAGLSFLSNSLLIILILDRRSRSLENYRLLLIAFAIVDILISVFNYYSIPIFYQIEYGLLAFTRTGMDTNFGFYFNATYVILFYEPFILITFHFVYRYLVLVREHLIEYHWKSLFSLAVLSNFALGYASYVAVGLISEENNDFFYEVMMQEFNINMSSTPRPSIIQANYIYSNGQVNLNFLLAMVLTIGVTMINMCVCAYCGIFIMKSLQNRFMSSRTRILQEQLFNALVVQFTVPCLLGVIPLSCLVVLPVTGIRFGETGNVMAIIISMFPIIDPIIVIVFLSRFRSVFYSTLSSALHSIGIMMILPRHSSVARIGITRVRISSQAHFTPNQSGHIHMP